MDEWPLQPRMPRNSLCASCTSKRSWVQLQGCAFLGWVAGVPSLLGRSAGWRGTEASLGDWSVACPGLAVCHIRLAAYFLPVPFLSPREQSGCQDLRNTNE